MILYLVLSGILLIFLVHYFGFAGWIGRIAAALIFVPPVAKFMRRSDLTYHSVRFGLCLVVALMVLFLYGSVYIVLLETLWTESRYDQQPPTANWTYQFELCLRAPIPYIFTGTCFSGNSTMCSWADTVSNGVYESVWAWVVYGFITVVVIPLLAAVSVLWFYTRRSFFVLTKKKRQSLVIV